MVTYCDRTSLASTLSLSYAAFDSYFSEGYCLVQTNYHLINFDPVAVSLGPLDIHWYGVMYLLAFLSFWLIANHRAARQHWWGWSGQDVSDVLFYGMLGVIVGGRVGYMLFYAFIFIFVPTGTISQISSISLFVTAMHPSVQSHSL